MYVCLSHTSREVDFDKCSLNYLTRRYASKDRLECLPPLESLSHEYLPSYVGNITIWELDIFANEPLTLRGFLRKNYKAQNAFIRGSILVICGTNFLELTNLQTGATHQISHPWFSGGHTVYPASYGQFIVSCSGSDAILVFNEEMGELTKVLRMPEEIYGHNYDLKLEDDLRQHYIHNDIQLTHMNSACECEKGYLVSALIPGAIGLFSWDDTYREITSGFIGCHGARTRPGLNGFYFTDSCTGLLIEMDWNGRILRRFSVESKWLHDCEWVEGDLYLFSLSDMNLIQLWDVYKGIKLWEFEMSAYGQCTQFFAIHANNTEPGLLHASEAVWCGCSLSNPSSAQSKKQERIPVDGLMAAKAYWENRQVLAEVQEKVKFLHKAVGYESHLLPYQYGQLIAMALIFKPDLILVFGAEVGHATCAFTQAAHILTGERSCSVISVNSSLTWRDEVEPRLWKLLSESWFKPVRVSHYYPPSMAELELLLDNSHRVLLYWNDQKLDALTYLLGKVIPLIESKQHLVIVHSLYHNRHLAHEQYQYGDRVWWQEGQITQDFAHFEHYYGMASLVVPLLDFISRSGTEMYLADRSYAEMFKEYHFAEMWDLFGNDETSLFSSFGSWGYFSLNTARERSLIFPAI